MDDRAMGCACWGMAVRRVGTCDPLRRLAALVILVLTSVLVGAQAQAGQLPAAQTSGSVPTGSATNEVRHLTFADAIEMALRYNLGAIESGENVRAARGQRLQALSALLPHVGAGASYNVAQLTSAALGFKPSPTFPIPATIGPFGFSTVSATVSQTVFSLESIQRLRAAQTAEQAAALSRDDMLDLITLVVGNAYLQVIDAGSRIEATAAQVRHAKALYDQAVDALAAGTSPKIDVTRTSVQLHTEEFNLTVARNNQAIAKLTLARAIGLPLGQAFDLADRLPYADLNPQDIDDALRKAYEARADFRAARQAVDSAQHEVSATRAQHYPVVAVSGDYGAQGVNFGNLSKIFGAQASISVPIYAGGRIASELTRAEAALQQRQAERENLRGQIDYDVRTAILNLQAAKEQVLVAREAIDLANESLARSQERFAAGVTDSVEVVQAQQALSIANDQYISGTYSHTLAKLQLARAMGAAHTSYRQYLAGQP
jgi:outer membrane protein TolC